MGEFGAGEEILIEDLQHGEETPGEEEAAVVAAAVEPGGKDGRQVFPAGMMGETPEDGVEKGARVSGGTAHGRIRAGDIRFEEAELVGSEEVENRFGGRRVEQRGGVGAKGGQTGGR